MIQRQVHISELGKVPLAFTHNLEDSPRVAYAVCRIHFSHFSCFVTGTPCILQNIFHLLVTPARSCCDHRTQLGREDHTIRRRGRAPQVHLQVWDSARLHAGERLIFRLSKLLALGEHPSPFPKNKKTQRKPGQKVETLVNDWKLFLLKSIKLH